MISKALIKHQLENYDCDAVLIFDEQNIEYLTGVPLLSKGMLLLKDTWYVFVDSPYAGIKMANIKCVTLPNEEAIFEWIHQLGRVKLGLEKKQMTPERLRALALYQTIHLKTLTFFIESMRLIKSETEIGRIKSAGQMASETFMDILNFVQKGMTERQVSDRLEAILREKGAKKLSFSTILVSGHRTALPHGLPSDKIINDGDFLTLDYGCLYNGYCSDMTRTILIGHATEKQRELYDLVYKGYQIALKMIKPGIRCSEIVHAVDDLFSYYGYYRENVHGLGHGIGLSLHEPPTITSDQPMLLQAGMVITLEPGLYIEGFGGVRIEDMILVKEDGYEVLTDAPKHLFEI